MRHEVVWDEVHACVRFNLHGVFAVEDAKAMIAQMLELLEGQPRRRLLVDHRGSRVPVPADTRAFFQANIAAYELDQMAFFGMNNLTRIAARIIITVTGYKDRSGFFKTEAEALAWLEGS